MEKPILQVKNLTTHLKIRNQTVAVVENLSFDLYPGRTLALVGESGCGKTLTALSLMRILQSPPAIASQGEVIYKNQNILKVSEGEMRRIRGGRIAMIFQDPSSALNPVYTIGNQLMEAVELHTDLVDDDAIAHVLSVLEEVGIPAPKDRIMDYPHQLSGGMRQRVMIAMALMCEPDILIADEPTTALDVTIQSQILDLIRSIQKARGMALLLITHDMGIVAEMADEVIVMYAAQSVEYGDVLSLFDHMSHPYTKGLFASRASGHHAQEYLYSIKGSVPPLGEFPQGCRFHPRCPNVMEKCLHHEPPNFEVGPLHTAKCWLYEQGKGG